MYAFATKFGQRFLPGVATNVLPSVTKAMRLPAIAGSGKPKSVKWKDPELVASHESYKRSQYKADYFAHLSTLDYAPHIQKELVRRSKAYIQQELVGRKRHTERFFGREPEPGHTHWEDQRRKYLD